MKKFLSICILVVMGSLIACEEETTTNTCNPGTLATVKDLTGLDGCGFVFELTDGTRLEPVRLFYCGTPPLPKEVTEDPLYNFELTDGKKVRINYVEANDVATICMAGKTVRITCIEEVTLEEK
jgi:hypothetical protein